MCSLTRDHHQALAITLIVVNQVLGQAGKEAGLAAPMQYPAHIGTHILWVSSKPDFGRYEDSGWAMNE